ncbi:MAG: prephenate dehydratase [Longimicrobiales bacterium]
MSEPLPEQPARVAFQGELGAFSEEAIHRLFPDGASPLPCRGFRDVGDAVIGGEAGYGLLPVENSLAGGVGEACDVLADLQLEVVAEVVQPIRHFMLGPAGAMLGNVRRVLSHPVALAQCRGFFATHPDIEAVAFYDTAGAAREVATLGAAAVAAIAPRAAAERYGLTILAENLQDRDDNQTRFLLVRREGQSGEPWPGAARKTALIAETADRPGALYDLLGGFAARGVNLTRLESRPGPEPWTYRFFIELDGDATSADLSAALEEAAARTRSLRVLGSFPTLRPAPQGSCDGTPRPRGGAG